MTILFWTIIVLGILCYLGFTVYVYIDFTNSMLSTHKDIRDVKKRVEDDSETTRE